MRFITLLTKTTTYFFAVALALAYLAPYVPSDVFWPIMFFGMAFPWLLGINIFILFFWLILWDKKVFIPLITVLCGLTYIPSFYGFNFTKPKSQENIRLISYNINSFYGVRLRSRHWLKKKNPVLELVKNQKSDFACFQELFGGKRISDYMKRYGVFEHEERPIDFFYEGSKTEFVERGFFAKDGLNGVSWFEV